MNSMKTFLTVILVFLASACFRAGTNQKASANQVVAILGSSTAQGIGASRPDSAWAGLVKAHFVGKKRIINLAKGGYTTYQMLDVGAPIADRRPAPDTARNITKALTYKPDVLVLSMTTNDVSAGFGLATYFANLDRVIGIARKAGVKRVYVTTSLPRSSVDLSKRQLLSQQRQQTMEKYGKMAIDLWEGFEGDSLKLSPRFDSGDHIHLNNAGHRILARRMITALQ